MNLPRDLLLLVTLAAAGETPALGQAVTPAVGSASSTTQGAVPIPDFSGVWVHPSWPGFEPPLSGAGPVVNKSRLPDGAGNSNQLVGDYSNLEAPGCRGCEEVRRNLVKRRGLSDPSQPVLASTRAVYFLDYRRAVAPAAG
jgi:hypothetical protein